MDLGDVPGWIALGVASGAAVLSWRSLRWEKLSAEAAGRSADEAARANRIAERALNFRDERSPDRGLPARPEAARPSSSREPAGDVGGDGSSDRTAPRGVSWHIEHPENNRYVLRNIGTEVATEVTVDESQLPPMTRNLPQDTVIAPGQGHDMLILGTWGHPVPNQLYLRWEGHPEWTAIPIR